MSEIWYPYTQIQTMKPPIEITKAKGVYLYTKNGDKLIDGISSWWSVIHGYNHPDLNKAMSDQLDKMAHVMLGGLTHQPVQKLAKKLIEITPVGLNHVFFSDSGSVGVEVALKMAIQYWLNQGEHKKTRFLAYKQSYHGDTCGAMSVCDPDDGMHKIFKDFIPKQYFLNSPSMGYQANQAKLEYDLLMFERALKRYHSRLAGVIIEPIMQAAGGFNFYSPVYLTYIKELCEKYNVLLIFDEVATGFGRTGSLFAADQANVCPDIMVLGKGLTSGYIGHAATLATTKIFNEFKGNRDEISFMHGPTFMGNPLAAAVALKSIAIFQEQNYLDRIREIESQLKAGLMSIQSEKVKRVEVVGATGVIEVNEAHILNNLQDYAIKRGVFLRSFDQYLYTMPAYTITPSELQVIIDTMVQFFL